MNEMKLTPRQSYILNIINESSGMGRDAIEMRIASLYPASKATVARDLALLVKRSAIRVAGQGRSTTYHPPMLNPLLRFFDIEQYFALEPDQRTGAKKAFDFSVFENLHHLLTPSEALEFKRINKPFSKAAEKLDPMLFLKELERFVIELSWKSSKIEGNTYSLLETEALLQHSQEAKGHSRQEVVMILNHKRAFESILAARDDYKSLTLSPITQLHEVLIKDLSIDPGIREQAVGITGTVYQPLDNRWQIHEALEKLVDIANRTQDPLEKALIANTMISYIQPFSDGNKRTGRMLTNAILLAHDYFPLSYRSVDEVTYKKALILFYEQNSIHHLKRMFLDQYRFVLNTYFRV